MRGKLGQLQSLVEFQKALAKITITVRNASGAPAIECKLLARMPDNGAWWLISLGDLRSNSDTEGVGAMQDGNCPLGAFVESSDGSEVMSPDAIILRSDILGRRFMFPIAGVFNGQHEWQPLPPSICPFGTVSRPGWASHASLWP